MLSEKEVLPFKLKKFLTKRAVTWPIRNRPYTNWKVDYRMIYKPNTKSFRWLKRALIPPAHVLTISWFTVMLLGSLIN